MTGNERERTARWIDVIKDWGKIEEATGVSFDEFDREYICLLVELASRRVLGVQAGAPLSEAQSKTVKAVADAAGRLQTALRKLDAGWLQERLLKASEAVRKERMTARELNRLKQGQSAATLLGELAAEPMPLTPDLLREFPSEVREAASLLVRAKGSARNRDADAMALRKRLRGVLRSVEERQHGRAAYSRFIKALGEALPADHAAQRLLGSAETAASSVRPSRTKRSLYGTTARKPARPRR